MRLLVHVEGQTEETFVNEILAPFLLEHGFEIVSARLLGNARLRARRGGIRSWITVRSDIANHLRQDGGACATLMVDYYALPGGDNGWPGRDASGAVFVDQKAAVVEAALKQDFSEFMGAGFNLARFTPYVMMHEFEGLLFSDCQAFADGIGQGILGHRFSQIRAQFDSPEHINDSPQTAPSKRVLRLFPEYQKTFHGPIAALSIGIEKIREECRGFDRWIDALIGAAR